MRHVAVNVSVCVCVLAQCRVCVSECMWDKRTGKLL